MKADQLLSDIDRLLATLNSYMRNKFKSGYTVKIVKKCRCSSCEIGREAVVIDIDHPTNVFRRKAISNIDMDLFSKGYIAIQFKDGYGGWCMLDSSLVQIIGEDKV